MEDYLGRNLVGEMESSEIIDEVNLFRNRPLYYRTIIRSAITCKKIPCYMRGSACRWFIVENTKIFQSYVKHF